MLTGPKTAGVCGHKGSDGPERLGARPPCMNAVTARPPWDALAWNDSDAEVNSLTRTGQKQDDPYVAIGEVALSGRNGGASMRFQM